MRIAIGTDHAGLPLREPVLAWLRAHGHSVRDFGTEGPASVDYPDFARPVAAAVASGEVDLGILMCGTGAGMAMTANKVRGVRAVCCSDIYTAAMARAHNDANVLCFGGRVIGPGVAERLVEVFLTTAFDGGRHVPRVAKIES